jgi:phosphatidate cytidylyltransferase
MKRLLTAAVGVPVALAAIFKLPDGAFFLVTLLVLEAAAFELVQILRPRLPRSPLWLLPLLLPAVAAALTWGLAPGTHFDGFWALGLAAAVSLGVGTVVLLAGTPIDEAPLAWGNIAFALLYFAVPTAAISRLHHDDPWLLFLLLAIVWLGDTAAYYVGTRFGRHRLAPVVSPKKSWEGAIAGLATSILSTAVWSLWRLDRLDLALVAIGGATAISGQLGDLVESIWKRGAGVKDSGGLLPGHGGLLDRMDAMIFAAPTLLLLLHLGGYRGTP